MDDAQALRELEESLWRFATRFDRRHMETILACDFVEFGRSGRIYSRAETLAIAPEEIRARLPLEAFRVREVADDVRLVTYVSAVEEDGAVLLANRSSLWRRTPSGWRLTFHQGTPTRR